MGVGDKVPERVESLSPLINLPISDALRGASSQQHRQCAFFEMQWARCLEAYGSRLGRKYCDFEHRDFSECVNHDKMIKRSDAIRAQRVKLYKEGKLKKAFEDDGDRIGLLRPDHFQWDRENKA